MTIERVLIETHEAKWTGFHWPWESRNSNAADAYEDTAFWDPPVQSQRGQSISRQLFVRIDAEGVTARYGPIEHWAAVLVREMLAAYLVGRDALRIVELHDRMQRLNRHGRTGMFMTAISAVDLCLWQLRGQVMNCPAYELLGGPTRDHIKAYASMLGFSIEPDKAAARAVEYRDKGYAAQKWFFRYGPQHGEEGMRKNIALVRALREALGETYPLMFDAFMGWNVDYTLDILPHLERFNPKWLEEPIVPEDLDGWRRIRRSTRIPLASGEHVNGRRAVQTLLSAGVIDVLQCDPDWAGGITELTAINHLASSHGVPVICHGHTLLPALHLAASQPPEVVPMVEHLVNVQEERHILMREKPICENGHFALPKAVGLGMDLSL